eukprot:980112-Alexandrium_andersonii.AAC.1
MRQLRFASPAQGIRQLGFASGKYSSATARSRRLSRRDVDDAARAFWGRRRQRSQRWLRSWKFGLIQRAREGATR